MEQLSVVSGNPLPQAIKRAARAPAVCGHAAKQVEDQALNRAARRSLHRRFQVDAGGGFLAL